MRPRASDVTVKKNVLIPMRDGTELAADLYVPAQGKKEGKKHPAIIESTPYHKDDLQKASGAGKMLTFFARRGYVGVELDIRGTGSSGGSAPRGLSLQDQRDGYDAVEWVAKQSFCDGKVGMTGVSYGGWTSYVTAIQNPPHLKAIAPTNMTDDFYLANYPGGSLGGYLFVLYNAYMLAYNSQPPSYHDPEGRWKRVWREHLDGISPWLHPWIENQFSGARVWDESSFRDKYERIRTPTFIIGGWHDVYPVVTRIFSGIRAPKKLLLGPWSHMLPDASVPGPRIDYQNELLRWFDHWLKGVDTGVTREPPIAIYVQRAWDPTKSADIPGDWRFENEWPVRRAVDVPFYLRENGSLSRRPSTAVDDKKSGSDRYTYNPLVGITSAAKWFSGFGLNILTAQDQRQDDALSLSYTSDTLEKDIEVTGTARVVLHISSSADVIAVVAKLCDVTPGGPSILVSTGRLNATHRDSHERAKPLKSGEVYELEVELEPTSYVFERGHRIRLSISNSDFPCTWPTPKKAECVVYRTGSRPSRMILPAIPKRKLSPASPSFQPPEQELQESAEPEVSWRTFRDELENTATVEFAFNGTLEIDRNTRMSHMGSILAEASANDPGRVRMDGDQSVVVDSHEMQYELHAKSSVRSDQKSFFVSEAVSIIVDGRPYFEKKWSKQIQRKGL